MFKKLIAMFSVDMAIDLGTANSLVYVKDRGIIINEPSVVAVNNKTGQILAIGEEAKKMVGRTPSYITATRPLVNGVISDFDIKFCAASFRNFSNSLLLRTGKQSNKRHSS